MEERRVNSERVLTEIYVLESRFDAHMKIYADNGVESKRVADALIVIQCSIQTMLDNSNSCGAQVNLMYAKHLADLAVVENDNARMKRIIQWGATIAAFGIIIALVKQVLVL